MAVLTMSEELLLNNEWMDLDDAVRVDYPAATMWESMGPRPRHVREGEEQAKAFDLIRHVARDLATCIMGLCPDNGGRSAALDALDSTVSLVVASLEDR